MSDSEKEEIEMTEAEKEEAEQEENEKIWQSFRQFDVM